MIIITNDFTGHKRDAFYINAYFNMPMDGIYYEETSKQTTFFHLKVSGAIYKYYLNERNSYRIQSKRQGYVRKRLMQEVKKL